MKKTQYQKDQESFDFYVRQRAWQDKQTLPKIKRCCYGTNAFYCIQCEQQDVQENSQKEK